MKTHIQNICWLFVLLGGIASVIQIFFTMRDAISSPQQAAGMAIAIAYAVVPYCFARAVEKIEIAKFKITPFLIAYVIWLILNLYLLLHSTDGINKLGNDIFIPFEHWYSDDFISWRYYDLSEFIVYTIPPLIVYGIFRLFKKKKKIINTMNI
jgi:hypothetical protein